MLNLIVQILLGIFVILIMGFIAYSIFDSEYAKSFRIAYSNKKETKVFTGIYSFNLDGAAIETINKNDPYYLDLNPSVNQNGGAEYSYNFWLYMNIDETIGNLVDNDGSTVSGDKFIVLFYKGLKQMIPYTQNRYSCDSDKGSSGNSDPYYLVKNPLIKINNNGKELVVEYNNINTPDTFNSSAVKLDCSTIHSSQNIYQTNVNKLGIKNINVDMYNKTWNMITVVMQESPSNEEKLFTNRTNCKVYFNSTLVADRSTYNNDMNDLTNENAVSTVMKNNIGRLHINPAKTNNKNNSIIKKIDKRTQTDGITEDAPVKMANMSYFNYALNDDDILILYKKGFSKEISDLSVRIMGLDKTKFIQGTKFNYNLSTDVDKIMPVEPI
jgi:hypothetical protein